jgi:hypothetical protein
MFGALEDLTDEWDSPVYAHPLELSYVSGRAPYSPGDPFVGGGLASGDAGAPVSRGRSTCACKLGDDGTLSGMPG